MSTKSVHSPSHCLVFCSQVIYSRLPVKGYRLKKNVLFFLTRVERVVLSVKMDSTLSDELLEGKWSWFQNNLAVFQFMGSKKLKIQHILWFFTVIFIRLVSPALYTCLLKIISHFVYMYVCVWGGEQFCKVHLRQKIWSLLIKSLLI